MKNEIPSSYCPSSNALSTAPAWEAVMFRSKPQTPLVILLAISTSMGCGKLARTSTQTYIIARNPYLISNTKYAGVGSNR
jgi:hypothetical protein